jgi:hypothetical protein
MQPIVKEALRSGAAHARPRIARMHSSAAVAIAALVGLFAAAPVRAADAPPSAPAAAVAAPAAAPRSVPAPMEADARLGGEPAVRHSVIEDDRARIEELRVRGQLQKVTVAPKGRVPGYEVLTGDGFHATAEDPGTSRGSTGKRVWKVLRF